MSGSRQDRGQERWTVRRQMREPLRRSCRGKEVEAEGVSKEQGYTGRLCGARRRGPGERVAVSREVGSTKMYNGTLVLSNDGVGFTISEKSGGTKLKANSTKNFHGMFSQPKTIDNAKGRLVQRAPKNSTCIF